MTEAEGMGKLTVEVVTPERRVLSVQADEAILPGELGLFGVRPRHIALVSNLDAGPLTLKDGGSVTHHLFIAGGFAQVAQDHVKVLADQAEPVASIDVEAARQRLKAAQERLKGMTTQDPGYEAQAREARREQARLTVAGRQAKA
jgi:F-type H+-transporting ATPase subunit epsilon